MKIKIINSKLKITLAFILIAITAIIAAFGFVNNASADEPKNTSNAPVRFHGVQIVGLNGENPSPGSDYTIALKHEGGESLFLQTPNWILTGTADDASINNDIHIQSNKVYIKDLTIDNTGLDITISNWAESCEVTLLKCTEKDNSTITSLSSYNDSLTINGEGYLHFSGGVLTTQNLTIDGVTLGLYVQSQYSNAQASYVVSVSGNFTMKSAKLIAENRHTIGDAYGAHFTGNVSIDESSEVFISGTTVSVDFNDETTLANALGSEEFISWSGDKSKVNKATANIASTGPLNYEKCIAETGVVAKTVYKAPVAPPTPPEPVTPTREVTAQTGDTTGFVLLAIAIIAMASSCICIVSRKKTKTVA